jgi:dihydrodipicolinate synthase/N-acetylneuraminate lyase
MMTLDTVFAVPPLPRKADARRTIDVEAAEQVAQHIESGGVSHLLYGGNAFLYHATAEDFDTLTGWLASMPASRVPIPSLGPSFGRAIDQARVLARYRFPAAMMLPCGDPRDPKGLEAGYREIAQAAGIPLIIYLKSEDAFGPEKGPGIDAIGRLIDDGVAIAIKYAVVLQDPKADSYLGALLWRVDATRVVSGMGERPAIVHLKEFKLAGMTTGSGCIAPRSCRAFYEACRRADWTAAEQLRAQFMPLEDLRDELGPARVLHHATECAGIACTGPIPPYVSALSEGQLARLAPVVRALKGRDWT